MFKLWTNYRNLFAISVFLEHIFSVSVKPYPSRSKYSQIPYYPWGNLAVFISFGKQNRRICSLDPSVLRLFRDYISSRHAKNTLFRAFFHTSRYTPGSLTSSGIRKLAGSSGEYGSSRRTTSSRNPSFRSVSRTYVRYASGFRWLRRAETIIV